MYSYREKYLHTGLRFALFLGLLLQIFSDSIIMCPSVPPYPCSVSLLLNDVLSVSLSQFH